LEVYPSEEPDDFEELKGERRSKNERKGGENKT
jgi:hypothetical protein